MNYAFTDYYQTMARVQFCLRVLDRRTGEPAAVRASFAAMVEAARDRRRIMRRPADMTAAAYLPRET